MFWRLVFAEVADLSELETHYTLADLARANDLLSAKLEAEALVRHRQRARAEAQAKR
jgi:hypothetical protein